MHARLLKNFFKLLFSTVYRKPRGGQIIDPDTLDKQISCLGIFSINSVAKQTHTKKKKEKKKKPHTLLTCGKTGLHLSCRLYLQQSQ